MKLKTAFYFFVLVLLFSGTSSYAGDQTALEINLRHAKTYYWLGLQDKGDPKAFDLGLKYLRRANQQLKALEDELDENIASEYSEGIRLLESDLKEQYVIASNNFAGRFPLVRFIGESPFLRPDSYGSYEIATPPGELSASRAAKSIGNIVNHGLWGDAQLPMLVFSKNDALPDVESALRTLFKHSYRIKVYERAYLNTFLTTGQSRQLSKNIIEESTLKKLNQKFGAGFVGITFVDIYNQVDDIIFYRFITNIYVDGDHYPAQSIVHYELVRDKRYMRPWLALLFLTFISLSILAFYVFNVRYAETAVPLKSLFLLPLASWIIGMASSMIVLSILAAIKPDYQDYITYSFWWVPFVLLLLMLASSVLVRKIILLSPWLKKYKGNKEESASLYMIASFGTSSLLGIGLLLYHHTAGIPAIIALSYLFGVSSYVFGKIMDRFDPRPYTAFIPFALLIPISAPAIAGMPGWHVYSLIGVTAAAHMWYLRYTKPFRDRSDDEDLIEKDTGRELKSLDAFKERIDNTPFFETAKLKSLVTKADVLEGNCCKVLCISGKDGVGKTTTAREIIRKIKVKYTHDNAPEVIVMKGFGEESSKKTNPYYAIRKALQGVFEVNPFESSAAQTDEIDSLLDGVVKNVVPFSGLFFPDKAKHSQQLSSQEELFYSLAVALKKMAIKQKVVFFLDDIHWLDDATFDLLTYLHNFFKQHNTFPILFLYTSRPFDGLNDLFEPDQVANVPAFTEREYAGFLSEVFRLEESSVRLIIKWVGGQSAGKGNMFWLFKILDLLVKGGHLIITDDHFKLSEDLLTQQKLPIPEEYRLTIREELIKQDAFKNIIGIAAVMGMQFDAFLVAEALDTKRLDCLEALDTIERESNILYDVTKKDGIFSFRSSFTLEAIRAELGIYDVMFSNSGLKQIVKEYYALVALVLEKYGETSELMRIASCYYNAGPAYASKAFDASLKACHYCIDLFRIDEARRFINMAEESKKHLERDLDRDIAMAIVKIRVTTSEGRSDEVKGSAFVKLLGEAEALTVQQLVHFVHYLYHVREFEKGSDITDIILQKAEKPYEIAQGLFWRGLCLPLGETNGKINELKAALKELEKEKNASEDLIKLKSQILNALGEMYSEMAKNDQQYKKTAREFLLQSIKLKSKPGRLDRAGLARSYGGLGRLELNVDPVDPSKALDYFIKDLELSKITGDYKGQVKMYSFIGACYLKKGDHPKAIEYYRLSYKMSTDPLDQFFALLGMLELSSMHARPEVFAKCRDGLLMLVNDEKIPDYCLTTLTQAIKTHPDGEELMRLLFKGNELK